MRHHGGTSTGITVAGGNSSSGVSDHASVFGSRCANKTAARLSAGLTPTVRVVVYGPMAATRSAHLVISAFSFGSFVRIVDCCAFPDGSLVKSRSAAPSPTMSCPLMCPAWHVRQLAETTSTPLAVVVAVSQYGSCALWPVRPGSISCGIPPVMMLEYWL